MSRPIRRARSTGCTISFWRAAKTVGIGIPRPNIDRVVAKNRFSPRRLSLFIATVAGLSREEFGHLSHGKSKTRWRSSLHARSSSASAPLETPRRHFSKANRPTGRVVESGPPKSRKYSGSGDGLSIVAPVASQAAITIEHTYVGALSPHPKLLRSSNSEWDRLVAALVLTILFEVYHPHVVVPYDVVLRSRHGFLLKADLPSRNACSSLHATDSRTGASIRSFRQS
jgi:hypothetical protein